MPGVHKAYSYEKDLLSRSIRQSVNRLNNVQTRPNMDEETLAHTKWNCKYHIVFAPKFRRQIVYGRIRTEIGKILRSLCERKGIEIIEAELCKDHIHMLIAIPPKYKRIAGDGISER